MEFDPSSPGHEGAGEEKASRLVVLTFLLQYANIPLASKGGGRAARVVVVWATDPARRWPRRAGDSRPEIREKAGHSRL